MCAIYGFGTVNTTQQHRVGDSERVYNRNETKQNKMNRKGLAILMRTRMASSSDLTKIFQSPIPSTEEGAMARDYAKVNRSEEGNQKDYPNFKQLEPVRDMMSLATSMNETNNLDAVLNNFSEGYVSLSDKNREELLLVLAKDYDLDRAQVRELVKQYLSLSLPSGDDGLGVVEEGILSNFYRMEKNLRHALRPKYEVLFERLNTRPGGLKFLVTLRDDILSVIRSRNTASVRALDSYLKEKLVMCLNPAGLELHRITWDDPASLLEKIVAYEAVHPISNLLDLKRRLGAGRRCFGYLHPAIPGEPLIFIEVALLKNVAESIQEVLWDSPPIPESEATCALFYSISSAQPGLAGVNLGKFLIKRVIDQVKKEMRHITFSDGCSSSMKTFATLSPIPGFMTWLLCKLASHTKLAEERNTEVVGSSLQNAGSAFKENILLPEEEKLLLEVSRTSTAEKDGMEVMLSLLTSRDYEWIKSEKLLSTLKPVLLRLCARYLFEEKKRGKALDSVANFHLQNGAMIERLNWMADRSEKGITQSGGIMVNYIYRSHEKIGEDHQRIDVSLYHIHKFYEKQICINSYTLLIGLIGVPFLCTLIVLL
ncbi:hypothetical protein V2J09_000482 [Rumex salicifolius]